MININKLVNRYFSRYI